MTAILSVLRTLYAERTQDMADSQPRLLSGNAATTTLPDGASVTMRDHASPLPGPLYRIEGSMDGCDYSAFIPKDDLDAAFPQAKDPDHLLLLLAHALAPVRRSLVEAAQCESLHLNTIAVSEGLPNTGLIHMDGSSMPWPVILSGDEAFGALIKRRMSIPDSAADPVPEFGISYRICTGFLKRGSVGAPGDPVHLEPGSALRLSMPQDEIVMLLDDRAALSLAAIPDGTWRITGIETIFPAFFEGVVILENHRGTIESTRLAEADIGASIDTDIAITPHVTLYDDDEPYITGKVLLIGGVRILVINSDGPTPDTHKNADQTLTAAQNLLRGW